MWITFFSGGIGLEGGTELLPIVGIKVWIAVSVIQCSELSPLFSVVRSDCLCLTQIGQRFVRGHVHRPDDGRFNMSGVKKSRQMIITQYRRTIREMSGDGLLVLRYD